MKHIYRESSRMVKTVEKKIDDLPDEIAIILIAETLFTKVVFEYFKTLYLGDTKAKKLCFEIVPCNIYKARINVTKTN